MLDKICNLSDVSRRIFIAVYWHGCLNPGTQKMKYTFIYTIIFASQAMFLPFKPK